MLKNLSIIALMGIAMAGVSTEAYAHGNQVASVQSPQTALSSIVRQVGDQTVTIQFYSPSIVRVIKSASPDVAKRKKSYSVILKPLQVKGVAMQEKGDVVSMQSAFFTIELNQKSGEITFLSHDGQPLLSDTKTALDERHDAANKGMYRVKQSFRLADDEAVYGLGQLRDTHMNQRGRHVELWNHNTYIAIPYFTSEKGYGVYWDNAGKTYFDDKDNATSFTSELGSCADYYFMYKDGTQDGVIASIRELTGQATLFPKWAMGFWQCRERYKTSDELAGVLDKYRE
ncbi:MAG TPA: xylosidase, partial [Prevotella sp.]|nr:xylosidase [Prevotella sp.]